MVLLEITVFDDNVIIYVAYFASKTTAPVYLIVWKSTKLRQPIITSIALSCLKEYDVITAVGRQRIHKNVIYTATTKNKS